MYFPSPSPAPSPGPINSPDPLLSSILSTESTAQVPVPFPGSSHLPALRASAKHRLRGSLREHMAQRSGAPCLPALRARQRGCRQHGLGRCQPVYFGPQHTSLWLNYFSSYNSRPCPLPSNRETSRHQIKWEKLLSSLRPAARLHKYVTY